MRKILAVFFGLALFVPLAACGGGDDEETSSDRTTTTVDDDEETTTTEDADETTTTDDDGGDSADGGSNPDSDYCDVVQDVIDLDEFIDDDFDFTDPEALGIVSDALNELKDAADDADIEDDYDVVIDGFGVLVEAFQEAGDDPEAQAAIFSDPDLQAQFEDFDAAGERIDEFTLEQCGQTLDGDTSTGDDFGESEGTIDDGEDTSLEDFADDVDACESGDFEACDTLYNETPFGSEAEAVALECGGEDPGGDHTGDCVESFG